MPTATGPTIPLSNHTGSTPESRMTYRIFTLAALATTTACAGARPAPSVMGPAAAMARARADSLRYPYTKADIDFMSGMIHHHAQAIQIAKWAPTHGASPAMIRLTERIINAQRDEIALMGTWLQDRNQPVPDADTTGTGGHAAMGHAGHSMSTMPGMLTAEQLAKLDAARGGEFDRLFLTYMIQHHRGAVDMVKTLFASHGAGQDETIFKFASDVETDQTTEINRMLQMLLELP
jgi:uncharacterized protein (DUF305 family)